MSKKLIHISSDTLPKEAADLMLENQIRHLAVMDDEKLVGVVSMIYIFQSINLNK